ncbi:MAG: histidinol-phosphate transaminase [Bacteroidia bacterium]|nr:histidinol-phosphate transaminase [Bacteroidia bacterium]
MTTTGTQTDITAWIRPHLLRLAPYRSTREDYTGATDTLTLLDANENPYPAPYHRYPDPQHTALKARVGALLGAAPEQLLLGNGSDEAIDLLIRATCVPGESRILTFTPTFDIYGLGAEIHGAHHDSVPLGPGFRFPTAAALAALRPTTRLTFVCTPNNPSGSTVPPEAVLALLAAQQGFVVVDEAYIEYQGLAHSWLPRLVGYPNLVVLRTFSKAWGLAGLRLGVAAGHPTLMQVLAAIKGTFNLSSLVQVTALELLADPGAPARVAAQVAAQVAERERLAAALSALPGVVRVHPSDANFLLVELSDAETAYRSLLALGILTRNRSRVPGCEGCLRISVGTPSENDRLLEALPTIFR